MDEELEKKRDWSKSLILGKILVFIQIFTGLVILSLRLLPNDSWDAVLAILILMLPFMFISEFGSIFGIILSLNLLIRKKNKIWGIIILITSLIAFVLFIVHSASIIKTGKYLEEQENLERMQMEECYENVSKIFASPLKIVDVDFSPPCYLTFSNNGTCKMSPLNDIKWVFIYTEKNLFTDFEVNITIEELSREFGNLSGREVIVDFKQTKEEFMRTQLNCEHFDADVYMGGVIVSDEIMFVTDYYKNYRLPKHNYSF